MNIALWILQALLAVLFLSGGAYKLAKPELLASQARALNPGLWRVLGLVELLGGVLLLTPALKLLPEWTPLAAGALALETLFVAALYGRRSVKLVTANPFTWAAAMLLMAAFVAYGRYALSPIA